MIQRDKTHSEQIERWANYVKNNPDWKKEHKQFIEGQIIIARRAYDKLSGTSEGREKIKLIRENRVRK